MVKMTKQQSVVQRTVVAVEEDASAPVLSGFFARVKMLLSKRSDGGRNFTQMRLGLARHEFKQ
jgi:hypothetical protein